MHHLSNECLTPYGLTVGELPAPPGATSLNVRRMPMAAQASKLMLEIEERSWRVTQAVDLRMWLTN